MSIKGIIFDFDGTLFDSMSIWETAGSDFLNSIGEIAENDLSKKLSAMSLSQSAEYLKKQYSLPMTVNEIINGINKIIEDYYLYQIKPKKNVITVLSDFKEKGIKMCIATATDRYLIEAALKRYDMVKYFDVIFTCSEVGHGKDEPYIFEYACEYLKVNKGEIVIFEDAYHAAETAKNAGFYVVGVYDKYENLTDELKKISDIYINSFAEMRCFE